MAKNHIKNRDVYNRYYGDFRGVDFSSDHTQVIEQRLAYAVNMYKDYQSGQGKALETIPGFRKRLSLPNNEKIYGIHQFKHKGADGNLLTKVLVHSGKNLYLWGAYPFSANVNIKKTFAIPEPLKDEFGNPEISRVELPLIEKITSLTLASGETLNAGFDSYISVDENGKYIDIDSTYNDLLHVGDIITITYLESEIGNPIFQEMNERKSTSFIVNNRLYIIDGKNYLCYDGSDIVPVSDQAYIPTTYINITSKGTGDEYEHRNLLQPKFKHTFISDGENTKFYFNEPFDEINSVVVDGKAITDFTANAKDGFVEINPSPGKDAKIEITASKKLTEKSITNCTITAIFDNRVFMSGNESDPNRIYFSSINSTGYSDPTYFPAVNFVKAGEGIAPVTGLIVVSDTLMALKSDTQQDGSVYYLKPIATEDDLYAKVYSCQRGLAGIGCYGACVNFIDDPVFVSRLGVEGIGQLSARYERAIEHRSSLIDAKLVNTNLAEAELEEWNGYLFLLVDGKMFLADSRQRYMHDIGVMQYEWYYLEDIGVYPGQYPEYRYASQMYYEIIGKNVIYDDKGEEIEIPLLLAKSVFFYETGETKDLTGIIANPPDANGQSSVEILHSVVEFTNEDGAVVKIDVDYVVHEVRNELTGEQRYEAYLCESKGSYTGGIFKKACNIKNLDDNLFFGTEDGNICSFNFDKRNEWGEIPPQYYSFDERVIKCGCATKMDCCGIPHLTKNTVKKSTVIKTKTLPDSSARIKVRTNNKPYNQIARINSKVFSFDNIDFSNYSFVPVEQSLFSIKEKEKQWVEKQYYIYSDDYLKPFALYYISYRYVIAGRYKE